MTSPSTRRFGFELGKHLVRLSMMEADLSRVMTSNGNRISRQYVNMILHNVRTPGPDLIECLGDALRLTRDDRTILHRAAALDWGYRIGSLRRE